jgi:FtsZ-binding cell division protein ZapB
MSSLIKVSTLELLAELSGRCKHREETIDILKKQVDEGGYPDYKAAFEQLKEETNQLRILYHQEQSYREVAQADLLREAEKYKTLHALYVEELTNKHYYKSRLTGILELVRPLL